MNTYIHEVHSFRCTICNAEASCLGNNVNLAHKLCIKCIFVRHPALSDSYTLHTSDLDDSDPTETDPSP